MSGLPPGFKVVSVPSAAPGQVESAALPAGFKVVSQPADTSGIIPQGLSGVNEGLANFLSLPNSIELGARSIGPLIVNAFGGNAAMPTESLLPDAGQSYRTLANDIGAVKPETSDPMGRAARRVGEELGSNLLPIAAGPAKVASAISTLGAGGGAALMRQIFPDNKGAEFAGEMAGGFVPLAIANALERRAMAAASPSVSDLEAQKTAAYKAVDSAGVRYTPQARNQLVAELQSAGARINPARHPKAASVLAEITDQMSPAPTLGELDELRQVIKRDLLKAADGGERYHGYQLQNALDRFIEKAGPQQILSGDPQQGAALITKARELNSRFRKTEDVSNALWKAENAAKATGSGGGLDNAIRQKLKSILESDRRTAGYTEDELAALEKAVRGGDGEGVLRVLGKLSPGGNGLMAAMHAMMTASNPFWAAVPGVAYVAKKVADSGTINRAKTLQAMLARGGGKAIPAITPNSASIAEALLAGQAANQNSPDRRISDALLRASGQ